MIGFIRTFDRDAKILSLLFSQLCQLDTYIHKVQTRHLFIQLFGQCIHFGLVGFAGQFDLRQALVGEAVAHDKTGVPRGTAQVYQAPLGSCTVRKAVGPRLGFGRLGR